MTDDQFGGAAVFTQELLKLCRKHGAKLSGCRVYRRGASFVVNTSDSYFAFIADDEDGQVFKVELERTTADVTNVSIEKVTV